MTRKIWTMRAKHLLALRLALASAVALVKQECP
jgi:hypothetical protein